MAITGKTSSKKKNAKKVPKAHSGKVMSKDSYEAKKAQADILIEKLPAPTQSKKQKKEQKSSGGRKSVFTEIVLKKLEAAFSLGMTDEEASFYAGIEARNIYNEQKRNPEFLQKKQFWKGAVRRKAVANIAAMIEKGDDYNSRWYLERRDRKNFGPGLAITDGEKETSPVSEEDSEMHKRILQFNLKTGGK